MEKSKEQVFPPVVVESYIPRLQPVSCRVPIDKPERSEIFEETAFALIAEQ
jgi:hypothetical protein